LVWNIELYKDENGKSNVEDFLNNIEDKKLKVKILHDINVLRQFGTALKEPHVKHLEDGIWELRTKQSSNIARVLYFTFTENKIILLNGFVKKTKRTPPEEIKKAKRFRDDYKRSVK